MIRQGGLPDPERVVIRQRRGEPEGECGVYSLSTGVSLASTHHMYSRRFHVAYMRTLYGRAGAMEA